MTKIRSLLLCLVLAALHPSVSQGVETAFGALRQKEYYFSNSFGLNWFKAVEYCRSRGMFLLSVRNAEEREAIIEYIDSTGYLKTHKGIVVWISANDLGEEGEFHWASTGERVRFQNWSPTEPNDYKIDDCTREDCAILEYWAEPNINYNYTFNDRACIREYQFICETLPE